MSTAAGVEIAQLAGEAGFIAGTAFTMIGITLLVRGQYWQVSHEGILTLLPPQGLAVGFVLLRAESIIESQE